MEIIEVSRDEVKSIQEQQRFKELKNLLDNILSAVSKKEEDESIDAIEQVEMKLDIISKIISTLNNDDNTKKVLSLQQQSIEELRSVVKELQKKRTWEFDVERDFNGFIKKVTAKQV